jgi:hypothetical protein
MRKSAGDMRRAESANGLQKVDTASGESAFVSERHDGQLEHCHGKSALGCRPVEMELVPRLQPFRS